MKDKIAFIAVGQAGGNLGQLFEEYGCSVFYMNTSQEDLDTLTKAKYRYHLTGGEGCNKNRNKAKRLVVDDFDNIIAELEGRINMDSELIYVLFSSGGGTGSGAGPMLIDLLLGDGHTVGAVTILPALNESPKAHINSYECLTELTKLDDMAACFILDNEKEKDIIESNQRFVAELMAFLNIPESYRSVKGNIDKAEIMETLKAHGRAAITYLYSTETAEVIQQLKKDMDTDGTVKYITSVLADDVDAEAIDKAIGMPLDTFRTYSEQDNIICASGLSFPKARFDAIYDKAVGSREQITRSLAATKDNDMKQDVNFLDELEGRTQKPESKPRSKRDMIMKYLNN